MSSRITLSRTIKSIHLALSKNYSTQSRTTTRAYFATHKRVVSEPTIHPLFETTTNTWQYIVADPITKHAVIIDPVLDYDPVKIAVSTSSDNAIIKIVKDEGYQVDIILETHAHADHLTAASYVQSVLSKSQSIKPAISIGSRIKQVQKLFGDKYGVPSKEYDTVFDKLWEDNEEFAIGTLTARAVHLPGHTPDHMGYQIGNNVFVGDSIFNVDVGSARADFPGGSAKDIFKSGRKLLSLPEDTKIWVGHDYPPEGRDALPFAAVGEHKKNNKHLKDGTQEDEFVEMRRKRDATLAAPRLIHPSLQVNIRGGQLPAPSTSGSRMFHLPLATPTW
ncbi:hypothetical protein FPOAC1_007468 [Fusarium poae]|uniref:Metallo-beta-lactamase domain-containing protein n=1 Tax=Fusarium poae TaxID=36050 RepID=A0A1B8ARF5_FUSPO|nr:hypothetical protein FPOAC1_007468 [Fusarium poae]KAG8668100.1 hypothetical protein FPOAC1_007468 [Fusarium poae]OBS22966.1 hypothetical protein FPOA_09287 [Fusarium poae]